MVVYYIHITFVKIVTKPATVHGSSPGWDISKWKFVLRGSEFQVLTFER